MQKVDQVARGVQHHKGGGGVAGAVAHLAGKEVAWDGSEVGVRLGLALGLWLGGRAGQGLRDRAGQEVVKHKHIACIVIVI